MAMRDKTKDNAGFCREDCQKLATTSVCHNFFASASSNGRVDTDATLEQIIINKAERNYEGQDEMDAWIFSMKIAIKT